jgi:nucleoside-diphosphate-sugar epimerase
MTDQDPTAIGRALITGAGGFIGNHLTRSLVDSGVEVTVLDVDLTALQPLSSGPRCRFLQGSIENSDIRRDALAGVDTVFHLAAAHLGVQQEAEEFRRVNVEATRSLAEQSSQAGVRCFVHCSSVGVYGRIETPPANEETPCHPELAYEQTKLEGEKAILQVVEDHGLPALILRPVWVYGPDCQRTRKLFKTIAAKRFLVAGKGDGQRHCIFIDDMVTAMIQAAMHPELRGEVFVIGDDRPVTIRFLVDEIARLVHAPPPRSIPFGLMSAIAATSEAVFRAMHREPPVSRRSLRFFTGNTAFDTEKAKRLLGLAPSYDLRRGLAETYRRLQEGS